MYIFFKLFKYYIFFKKNILNICLCNIIMGPHTNLLSEVHYFFEDFLLELLLRPTLKVLIQVSMIFFTMNIRYSYGVLQKRPKRYSKNICKKTFDSQNYFPSF